MKRIGKLIKNNKKLLFGVIIGVLLTSTTVYAVQAIATSIAYDNTTSGLQATNVQDALDELYTRAKISKRSNFIEAYTYNASTCVTGEEDTCVPTTCYKIKSAGACPQGTIIKYKVRPSQVEVFHVMYDDANTITMQAQKNTIYNVAWITSNDYGGTVSNNKGPLTILLALENATAGWTNVNNQTYTVGIESSQNNLMQCGTHFNCTESIYTLSSRTAKARMITLMEADNLGCREEGRSCPIWMYNYLSLSQSNGGTNNDTSHGSANTVNDGYWTMTPHYYSNAARAVFKSGGLYGQNLTDTILGARAVVVVNKP